MAEYEPPGPQIPAPGADLPLMEAIQHIIDATERRPLSDKVRLGAEVAHELAFEINRCLGPVIKPEEIYILLNYDVIDIILPAKVQWLIAQHEVPDIERLWP